MAANTAEKPYQKSYPVGVDDKIVPIMVYSPYGICWGDVIIKERVRASTWLRTNAAPDNLSIYHARYLITTSPECSLKPMTFQVLHVPVEQVLAFHIIPPAADPLDYDPSEPNRKMDPVAVLVNTFIMEGFLRLSSLATIGTYLDVNHETFTPLYNAEIRCLLLPALGKVRVPYVLIRQLSAQFAARGG